MKKDLIKTAKALEEETNRFYRDVDMARRIDKSFSKPDDEPLTDDEKKQIDEYWGKYKFAYPNIDYESFKTFKNRCGKFDVRHCPGAIRTQYFKKYFNNSHYIVSFQNKVLTPFLYQDIKQPDMVVGQANGVLLTSEYKPLTFNEAVDEILRYVAEVNPLGVVVKQNMASGGKGVDVITGENVTRERVTEALKRLKLNAYVVQGFLKQSEFMSKFHGGSVNTIRVTTLLHNGRSKVLAALIRAGSGDSLVDNWCSGGSIIGVDKETGKLNSWALSNDRTRISTLSNGLRLDENELYIPNYERVKEAVISCHYRNPYIKMISWDVALDENNEPTLIECNFGGMIQIHEATTGPLFGEYFDELLDEYLIKRFSISFAEQNFICKEFCDHVTITEYIGDEEDVAIPETLRDKPVTLLEKNVFKGMNIPSVTVSKVVAERSVSALSAIKNVIKTE